MVDSSDSFSLYQERAKFFKQQSQREQSLEKILAWFRILVFLGFLLSVYAFFKDEGLHAIWLGIAFIALLLFLLLLKFHNLVKGRRVFFEQKARLNEDVDTRRNLNLKQFHDGKEFIDPRHAYTSDLDIFGDYSVFQLVNQSHAIHARRKLADWFIHPAPIEELKSRQELVEELIPEVDFRHDVLAYGSLAEWDKETWDAFKDWLQFPQVPMPSYWFPLALFLSIVHLIALMLWYYGMLAFWWLVPVFLPAFFLLYRSKPILENARKANLKGQIALEALAKSLVVIDNKAFESNWAKRCQSRLKNASLAIHQWGSLTYRLENRGNAVYSLLNLIFLLDIHQRRSLQQWRRKYEEKVSDWFDAHASIEAILSLAGLKDSFPNWVIPELTHHPLECFIVDAGHPLIPDNERVANNLTIRKGSSIGLITGSNMAGKSTFLRTVGVNLVLAQAGAPVCASQFRTGPWRLFTGMRVGDDLRAKTSSFFAELKRIRQILFAAGLKDSPPVFYLLDEVLKGTNSADRQAGARGLIRQLSLLNAAGLVSTHDVELVDLEKSVDVLKNYSFHSDVIKGQLHFDYRLKEGPCPQFNAADLMAMMGIKADGSL
jgi:ABC-type multidrug transport system fused ATPase/permease subunit